MKTPGDGMRHAASLLEGRRFQLTSARRVLEEMQHDYTMKIHINPALEFIIGQEFALRNAVAYLQQSAHEHEMEAQREKP